MRQCGFFDTSAERFRAGLVVFVADCGQWFVLPVFVNLRQTVEESLRLRFQSKY
jgi:hypothetical protein